ncbi:hypothetical protein [Nannocystis bainbridge]|uniref:Uncharacterized protein n=1 Tax=Nannocystis bainbridge TaxID=2995303 RepID=A0ABT5E4T8_9BACT|nr:hypothetical protein [Nannocystis bainbridge]MDC0720881.1 hypothetical protein [Nannocystis bainbridge]
MRAAEGGSDDWAIDQAFAEYEAYSAGERLSILVDETAASVNHLETQVQRFRFAWPSGGEVHFCGAPSDEVHWHASYVGEAGQFVTPLVVGELADVKATWARIRDSVDPHQLPPPVVRLGDDQRRYFKPTHGRFLVGVAEQESNTILLVSLGRQVAVVLVEGQRRVVLDIKAPLDLREVLVDRMRSFQRVRTASSGSKPSPVPDHVRVSAATRARYLRIVHGLPTDVMGGPSIPDVVWRCFKGLEHRAMALRSEPVRRRFEQGTRRVQEPCRPRRLKGKKYLPRLLRALFQCSLKGSDDLVGLTGVLRGAVQRHDPSFEITLEALADTLNLLRAAGTCLVTRDEGERIWHIHLVGLNDPSTALHRRLLEETPIPFRFPASATGEVLAENAEATPPAHSKTPSSPWVGGTSAGSPHQDQDAGVVEALGTLEQVSAAHHKASAEALTAVAAENAASLSEGDAATVAQLASSPLAPLLALAAILRAWEAAPASDRAQVIAVRKRLGTVLRELVHLHPQSVSQPLEPAAERAREERIGRPAEPERVDVTAGAASAPVVRDEGDRPPADGPGEVDASVGAAPAIGLTGALDLREPVMVSLLELHESTDFAEAEDRRRLRVQFRGGEPPANLEAAGFLTGPRWFWPTRPSLDWFQIPAGAGHDGDDRSEHDWAHGNFDLCLAPATPSGPWVLGSLGARGPPGSWR